MARIQIRRDTSANWTCANPVLFEGELAYETDTKILKIGDGASQYNNVSTLSTPDLIDLTSISVCTNLPYAGGSLEYCNTTGEFFFEPADLSNTISLTDISVCTNLPNAGGSLEYCNTTGEFFFEPADLSSVITQLDNLSDVDACTNFPTCTQGLVLTSDGDGSYSFQCITNTFSYNYTSNQYIGNGTCTDYTIECNHTVNDLLVILDGNILPPVDYCIINNNTLRFVIAPLNLQSIDIRYLPV